MDILEILEEILEDLLRRLQLDYKSIEVTEEEKNNYQINIVSDNPSEIIGYHGQNIQAIQHVLKVLCWQKAQNSDFNIVLDVDNYRQRREEKCLNLAQRKVDMARKTGRPQTLPPMSGYLRRKVHMYCMGAGFDDIETYSEGDGKNRHIIIRVKH